MSGTEDVGKVTTEVPKELLDKVVRYQVWSLMEPMLKAMSEDQKQRAHFHKMQALSADLQKSYQEAKTRLDELEGRVRVAVAERDMARARARLESDHSDALMDQIAASGATIGELRTALDELLKALVPLRSIPDSILDIPPEHPVSIRLQSKEVGEILSTMQTALVAGTGPGTSVNVLKATLDALGAPKAPTLNLRIQAMHQRDLEAGLRAVQQFDRILKAKVSMAVRPADTEQI